MPAPLLYILLDTVTVQLLYHAFILLLCIYFVIHCFKETKNCFPDFMTLKSWRPISHSSLTANQLEQSISSLSILSSTHTTGLLCYPWSERGYCCCNKGQMGSVLLENTLSPLCTFSLILSTAVDIDDTLLDTFASFICFPLYFTSWSF